MNKPPLPLGTEVSTLGKIQAVGLTGGERYYWLVDKHGTVSMMPWFVVEAEYSERLNSAVQD